MKFIFTFLFCLALGVTTYAQNTHAKYNVKAIKTNGKVIRGKFYAATETSVSIIRNRRDTLLIGADSLAELHVKRRGLVAPLAIAGGLTFFALAVSSDKLVESVVFIVAGVPAGVSAGVLLGNALSKQKHFVGLKPVDFPKLKPTLQQYTMIK